MSSVKDNGERIISSSGRTCEGAPGNHTDDCPTLTLSERCLACRRKRRGRFLNISSVVVTGDSSATAAVAAAQFVPIESSVFLLVVSLMLLLSSGMARCCKPESAGAELCLARDGRTNAAKRGESFQPLDDFRFGDDVSCHGGGGGGGQRLETVVSFDESFNQNGTSAALVGDEMEISLGGTQLCSCMSSFSESKTRSDPSESDDTNDTCSSKQAGRSSLLKLLLACGLELNGLSYAVMVLEEN